jgi:cytochrome c2
VVANEQKIFLVDPSQGTKMVFAGLVRTQRRIIANRSNLHFHFAHLSCCAVDDNYETLQKKEKDRHDLIAYLKASTSPP